MFFIFIAWFYGRSLFGHGLFLFEWNLIELWFSELHIILLFFFFAIDRYRVCVDQNPDRHCSSRMNRRTESINKTNIFDTVKRDQPKLALELIQLNKFTKFQTKCIILLVSVFTFDAAPERRRIRRFFFSFFSFMNIFFLWRTFIHRLRNERKQKNAKIPKPFIMLEMARSLLYLFVCCSFEWFVCIVAEVLPGCGKANKFRNNTKKKHPTTFTFTNNRNIIHSTKE